MASHGRTPGGPLPGPLAFFDTPSVSSRLWAIASSLIGIGLFGLIAGVTYRMGFLALAPIGFAGVGMIMAGFGKEIKASNPTQVGVLTIWGGRRNVLLKEGIPLTAPYWPVLVDFEPVEVNSVTCKAEWIDVSTRAESTNDDPSKATPQSDANGKAKASIGALVRVAVELLIEPDYHAIKDHEDISAERINTFINRGGMKNATTVILNKIEEATRSVALAYDWESFIGMKKPLAALLITLVSETKLRRLRNPGEQKVPTETELANRATRKITLESYDEGKPEEYEDDVILYLEQAPDAEERKQRLKEIDFFLKAADINGTGDVPSLGIKILILNVTAIEATGEAKKAADAASAEKKQREQESADFATERMLIDGYREASRPKGPDGKSVPGSEPTVSYEQAAAWVRVNRNRATERIVNVTGSGTDLQKAAGIITASGGT